jgi:secreted trypsin-like serine protease
MEGSRLLTKGNINVVEREQCTTSYFNHFCAGPSNIGGCQGDDGGATICDGILHGLVGWRYEDYCSEAFNAHLYVDLAPYHEWIFKLTNSSSKAFPSLILVVLGIFVKFCQF